MKYKGDIYLLISYLIFGSYGIFLRLLPNIPIISFLFFVQLIGAISFFILTAKQGFPKISKIFILLFSALAILALLHDFVFYSSFRLTSIANAALAHRMVPIFLLFIAPILLKEKTQKDEWISLVVALTGVTILYYEGISIHNFNDIIGITLSLLSAFLLAFIIILYRYLPKKGLTISAINFWRYGLSTLILFPIILIFPGYNFQTEHLLPLTIFSLLFAVIGSGINHYGISLTRSMHASILGNSEAVISAAYAFILLNEVPSIKTLAGGMLILSASIFLTIKKSHN